MGTRQLEKGLVKSEIKVRAIQIKYLSKPKGNRPLGRPRRRWEDNSKMDLREVGGCCGDWMELDQDREMWRALVSTLMNFRVP